MGICQSRQNKAKRRKNNANQLQISSYHTNKIPPSNLSETHCNTKTEPVCVDNALIDPTSNNFTLSEIKKCYDNAFEKLLKDKTAIQLLTECTNCSANGKSIDLIYSDCQSIERLQLMLKEYVRLIQCIDISNQTCLSDILTVKDKYTLDQITNDFLHIKEHMDFDENVAKELTRKFRVALQCTNGIPIRPRSRFYPRNIKQTGGSIFNDEINKIHSCLTHVEIENADSIDDEIGHYDPGTFEQHICKREDDKWWDYDADDEMQQEEIDQNIYCHLVKHMNIFRWQTPHGFNNRHHHSLMHLKPRYTNIKEEALNNPYYTLSKDNWNQTLRKAKVFYNSFARRRIKSVYDGKYDDKITLSSTTWKQGAIIDMPEIVSFKLYTDYDKLQYELKKCFRFESMNDIFALNDFNPKAKLKYGYVFESNENQIKLLLEDRLSAFYWWRIKLMTTLNKYSKKLNPNIPYYHGVNGKMILNSGRNSIAFYGPLSTSSSYHVARTFATTKGMVLEVTTQYPRMGLCRAFDVSLISDYPEEKEQLVAFAYLRITKVFTRPLNKNWKTFVDMDIDKNEYNIPLSSITRSIFFAVHLFTQQMFSMSVHSEYWLTAFLYVHCKYNELNDNKGNGHIRKTRFVEQLEKINMNLDCSLFGASVNESNKCNRILRILSNKFDNFRKYPNRNQVVKIDRISDNLKAYFMDYVGLNIHKKEKYIVSISKIVKIFPNVKEIHFINMYCLDDKVIETLVQYVENNPETKLKKIKFLYYDYKVLSQNGDEECWDEKHLLDQEQIDNSLLKRVKEMNWQIKAKQVGNTGYEIKVFANKIQQTLEVPQMQHTIEAPVSESKCDIENGKTKQSKFKIISDIDFIDSPQKDIDANHSNVFDIIAFLFVICIGMFVICGLFLLIHVFTAVIFIQVDMKFAGKRSVDNPLMANTHSIEDFTLQMIMKSIILHIYILKIYLKNTNTNNCNQTDIINMILRCGGIVPGLRRCITSILRL